VTAALRRGEGEGGMILRREDGAGFSGSFAETGLLGTAGLGGEGDLISGFTGGANF